MYNIWSNFWSKILFRQQQLSNPEKRVRYLNKLKRESRARATPRHDALPEKGKAPDDFEASWVGKPIRKEGQKKFYQAIKANETVDRCFVDILRLDF